jgi:DNA polymerase III sliding clamp (beta) subunit (PCNA family)
VKFTVEHCVFRDVVEALKPLTSKDGYRPLLQHVHIFSQGEKQLALEALDGYTLLRAELVADIQEPGEMLLPGSIKIPAAKKSTIATEVLVEGSMTEYNLNFLALGTVLQGRNYSIDNCGKFPDVNQILNSEDTRTCSEIYFDPALLETLARAFHTLLKDRKKNRPVRIRLHDPLAPARIYGCTETIKAEGIIMPVRRDT